MIFGNAIEHKAWNDSDQVRAVLLGDLWRPELKRVERVAIEALADR